MTLFLVYLITINIYIFILMGIDKKRSIQNLYRISEKKLLLSSFFMGGLGLFLGMMIFRHKTKKMLFIALSRLYIATQLLFLIYILNAKYINSLIF